MLSTVDNPYNPFTHFDEWYTWDVTAGYNTLAFLGRIVVTANDLYETDEDRVLDDAINEIITENVSGVHIKVTANDVTPREQPVTAA